MRELALLIFLWCFSSGIIIVRALQATTPTRPEVAELSDDATELEPAHLFSDEIGSGCLDVPALPDESDAPKETKYFFTFHELHKEEHKGEGWQPGHPKDFTLVVPGHDFKRQDFWYESFGGGASFKCRRHGEVYVVGFSHARN